MEKSYLGSIKTKVEVPDITFKNREMLREFKRFIRQTHIDATREGEDALRDVLIKKDLVATGRLFRSVSSSIFVKGDSIFTGQVGFIKPGSEYAYFVEHGRGPNVGYDEGTEGNGESDFLANLKRWGRARGLSAAHIYFTYKKIKQYGYKGTPFMEDAEKAIDKVYNDRMSKVVSLYKKALRRRK